MESLFTVKTFGQINYDSQTDDVVIKDFSINHYGPMRDKGEGCLLAIIDFFQKMLATYREENQLDHESKSVDLDIPSPSQVRAYVSPSNYYETLHGEDFDQWFEHSILRTRNEVPGSGEPKLMIVPFRRPQTTVMEQVDPPTGVLVIPTTPNPFSKGAERARKRQALRDIITQWVWNPKSGKKIMIGCDFDDLAERILKDMANDLKTPVTGAALAIGLVSRIQGQIDHAIINNHRLVPYAGKLHGPYAVRVGDIEATIEGWRKDNDGFPSKKELAAEPPKLNAAVIKFNELHALQWEARASWSTWANVPDEDMMAFVRCVEKRLGVLPPADEQAS